MVLLSSRNLKVIVPFLRALSLRVILKNVGYFGLVDLTTEAMSEIGMMS